MLKNYFHNNKSMSENKNRKKIIPVQYIDQKKIVDINKLLNRVRINKKNETRREIIFYSSAILALGLFSTLVMIIR
jgi:hypothetical protein